MEIQLHAIVDDSIVDGPGIRMTLFTQGCHHKCPGCHNPQTHDISGGKLWDVEELLTKIQKNPLLDGITLSGGEPFLQSEACAYLADAVKKMGLSVWTYTGYIFEDLIKQANPKHLALLQATDVLIDGPFIMEQRSLNLRFKGSKNQRAILCNKSLDNNKIQLWEESSL